MDKIIEVLPLCDLFKDNLHYPKRYFDEIIIEEKGF